MSVVFQCGISKRHDPARAGAHRGSIPATRAMPPVEQQEASGRTTRRANEGARSERRRMSQKGQNRKRMTSNVSFRLAPIGNIQRVRCNRLIRVLGTRSGAPKDRRAQLVDRSAGLGRTECRSCSGSDQSVDYFCRSPIRRQAFESIAATSLTGLRAESMIPMCRADHRTDLLAQRRKVSPCGHFGCSGELRIGAMSDAFPVLQRPS